MDAAATALVPASDLWRHQLATRFAGLECVAVDQVEVIGTLADNTLGEVGVHRVTGSPQQVRRTPVTARREPLDLLKVCLMTTGEAVVEQDGTHIALGPGDFALYDTGRPYTITLQPAWSCLVMTVPRASLGLPDRTVRQVMSVVHDTRGAGQLLHTFLREAFRTHTDSKATSLRLGEAGVALLAGAVAEHQPRVGDLDHDDLRHQVVAWIRQHLHDPDLSTERIARALLVSTRSLQRLFEDEELGVAGLVRELRLDAVRRDLDDPALADCTVTWIAARWGVTDASWLSRAFRARYGTPPSAYRVPR
ncbi:helix-turn-helix domain-containing protein [Nitriliruptor alkaliphilus]|uniref:AraC-like ligand-binding domain-containing protein n=1 Tax=Nitriliruptor alkaliphilus TaxID=427918 RepID=UPI000696B334|nr:helix-turn-helix domain-containing protein [Nitriliruptor alkaliphilus]